MSPTEKQSFGMNGCEVVAAGDVSTSGAFCAIQFVTEGQIASITSPSIVGYESVVFPAGFVLYVPFTQVETIDCVVVVYKSSL